VQGVGFRPFVSRLASDMGLAGWVCNTMAGVDIEIEGESARLEDFVNALRQRVPRPAVIDGVTTTWRTALGERGFAIRESMTSGAANALLLPDLAPCAECLREVCDPADRRFRYPFASCATCGPRFTVMESLPYDRGRTTMRRFPMCGACRREYHDPADRRFHAETIACPLCGPQLAWWDADGRVRSRGDRALQDAVDAIGRGLIVALKGVGGFQLVTDARHDGALATLRLRKGRPDKPFAVLCASPDAAREICRVTEIEVGALTSPAAPIVLMRGRVGAVSRQVAPGNPWLGVMLPASPLHHLLATELGRPLVVTSGNRTDEPICVSEEEALDRLRGVADAWLVHDRPIARRADDSVVRVIAGEITVLRSGRGYAPMAVPLARTASPLIAVGTHLKNAVAITVGDRAVLAQHLGTLDSQDARVALRNTVDDLTRLYRVQPSGLACDLHPDDPAAIEARRWGRAVTGVQHHRAHVLSCMAEHGVRGPVLGVAWDGTGYGIDGTIWGGEFLLVDGAACRRAGHLRHFRLPGAERAVREPRLAALGVLFELFGDRAGDRADLAPLASLAAGERSVLLRMLARGVHAPLTSSAGRLFDAVAALCDLQQIATFEGQAAMALEFAVDPEREEGCAPAPHPAAAVTERDGVLVVDWQPAIRAILDNLAQGVPVWRIARAFHDALAEAVVSVADRVGERRVVLTGGCFQNRYLSERCQQRLHASGFQVYRHRRVPPNDGGIALGQLAAIVADSSQLTADGSQA